MNIAAQARAHGADETTHDMNQLVVDIWQMGMGSPLSQAEWDEVLADAARNPVRRPTCAA